MNSTCKHDPPRCSLEPGAPYTTDQCRRCWLYHHNAQHRAQADWAADGRDGLHHSPSLGVRSAGRVGSRLKEMLAQLGFATCGSCKKWAAEMDRWGTAGCLEQRGRILERLREQEKRAGIFAKLRAGGLAVLNGLPLSAEGLLDEAIRRAIAAQDGTIVVYLGSTGIGDNLQGLTTACGLKRQFPDLRIVYVACCDPNYQRDAWVRLFDGPDEVRSDVPPVVSTLVRPYVYNAQDFPGVNRWELYANRCGTTAALPTLRPLPAETLAWAEQYAGAVVLCPFSYHAYRRWPVALWLQLEQLLLLAGHKVVIVGGPNCNSEPFATPHKLRAEQSRTPETANAAQVAAVLKGAKFFVGNDSGMTHLAGLVGTPGLAVCMASPGDIIFGCYPSLHWRNGRALSAPSAYAAVKRCLDGAPLLAEDATCLHHTLADRVPQWMPRSYLEIGVREGDSLRLVLRGAGHRLRRVVLADNWSATYGGTGRGSHAHLAAMAELAGRDVRFLDGDSRATVPTLAERFDLITVDGDHSAEGARADLENVLPLVAPGGRIVFDDVIHPAHAYLRGVGEAFLGKHPELTLEVSDYAVPHGVMVFRRG